MFFFLFFSNFGFFFLGDLTFLFDSSLLFPSGNDLYDSGHLVWGSRVYLIRQ